MDPRALSRSAAALLALALVSPSAPARAQTALQSQRASHNTFRVDGSLRDWSSVAMQSFGSGDDASFEFAMAQDAEGLYVAARVRDERMIRTRRPGNREDVLVLTLATPGERGLEAVEFWLYAGEEGSSAAVALMAEPGGRPRPARGARILEAAVPGGYELEAYLPLALVPNPARTSAMRAAVRLVDVDVATNPTVEATVSSVPSDVTDPAQLPEVQASSGPASAVAAFRRDQGLANAPVRFEFWGDLAGDEREERVLIVGSALVVVGEGYRDGRGYDFERLGVRGAEDVQRARLEDITGDGKAEIILRLRERDRAGIRANWVVLGTRGEGIDELLSVPVFERTRQGIARARVELRRQRRGAAFIDVRSDGVERLDPATYRGDASDEQSVLLPWAPLRLRTYQWTGSGFAMVASEPNPNAYVPPTAGVERPQTQSTQVTRPAADPPRTMSDDEILARVRADRHVGASVSPRFRTRADVAEGREAEQVLALGGAIVVYGPGFQSGRGYFYFEAASQESELLSVQTGDLTGDGKHEILFTVRQNLGEFQRDILTVLQFSGSSIQPILRVEVARYHGDAERIVNQVQLRTRGRAATLSIAAGEARGWDQTTWPFSGFADDGIAPLLLPWAESTRRYRFSDGRLVSP
ncbi:MAG: hypothetical protein H6726_29595 [Sandaracinaceae bacterium]|nr:hypothetical protein [Sandaracinaceae bacterium]